MSGTHLGVDIEEVQRFQRLLRNKRFMTRVYTDEERRYCAAKKNQAQHLAVRFAAKEAVWKALSQSLAKRRLSLGHRDIGIRNDASGKPEVALPARLRAFERRLTVSLSHTRAYVVAVALLS